MMQLQNRRLNVEIAAPGTTYRGSRFDWSTFITQVTLDGTHTFCAPESLEKGEGSGGQGLCNEFGIFKPIGYSDAKVGESFPKLGVGLLRRTDENPYSFADLYPLEPFPLTVQEEQDAIAFEFEPLPCRGYEARLKKTISLIDNKLSIAYELENVGTKPLSTHEYNHNFLSIDGTAPSPDYRLHLSDDLELEMPNHVTDSSLMPQEDKLVRWNAVPSQAEFFRTANNLNHQADGAIWQLRHEPSGCGISETLDCPIKRLALWCAPHVMSPEVFVDINVAPGEQLRWTRAYKFWTGSDKKHS